MKSFLAAQNISCIILGLDLFVSAHAVEVKCGDNFDVISTSNGNQVNDNRIEDREVIAVTKRITGMLISLI